MALNAVHLPNGTSSNTSMLRLLGVYLSGSGVAGSGFTVSAQDTPNMSIKVSGSTTDDNLVLKTSNGDVYHLWNTADENVTIESNATGVSKTDWIVAYADTALSSATPDNPGGAVLIAVRKPSGAGAPTTGDVDTAVSNNPWVKLGEVVVGNGVSSINSGNITDSRTFAMIDGALLKLESVDTAQIADAAVTDDKLSLATTTDANGWKVTSIGGIKLFSKSFSFSPGSMSSGASVNMGAIDYPAGETSASFVYANHVILSGFSDKFTVQFEGSAARIRNNDSVSRDPSVVTIRVIGIKL